MARFSSIFIVPIILILFSVSLVHSSRYLAFIPSALESHETTVPAATKAGSVAQDHQVVYPVKRMGDADASNLVPEEPRRELRQASHGPDPLHHDSIPTARP